MGFRCELCDDWLSLMTFCKLCDTCYKLRTIVKCYTAEEILKCSQEHFLVSHAREEEEKTIDKKFFKNEEIRITKEFEEEIALLQKREQQHLTTIAEEKDISELAKNNSETEVDEPDELSGNQDNTYQTRNKKKKKNVYI